MTTQKLGGPGTRAATIVADQPSTDRTGTAGRRHRAASLTARDPRSRRTHTSVFVVDDHAVARAGVRRMLESAGGFEVVGEAGDAPSGLLGILDTEPDIALLDMRLPGGDGVEIIRELRSRGSTTRCVVLTTFPDEAAFFQAVVAGAAGYILKERPEDELIDGCRRVAAGDSLLAPEVLDELRGRIRESTDQDRLLAQLTPQERRILQFVSEGMTNREIADRLGLAEKTVRNYVSNVLTKLDMKNRTMAAAYMAQYHARAAADRATSAAASTG